jgi:hypothetical protein
MKNVHHVKQARLGGLVTLLVAAGAGMMVPIVLHLLQEVE